MYCNLLNEVAMCRLSLKRQLFLSILFRLIFNDRNEWEFCARSSTYTLSIVTAVGI